MKITSFKDEFSFLSNFSQCDIFNGGIYYPSVEHAYQASKTNNLVHKQHLSSTINIHPAKAKQFGRRLNLRLDWEQVKIPIMEYLLILKFNNIKLKNLLLSTNGYELIEGNTWHDNFWGACSCEKCVNKVKHNHLGKLLMKIRDEK